jgi:hypothetical protein
MQKREGETGINAVRKKGEDNIRKEDTKIKKNTQKKNRRRAISK